MRDHSDLGEVELSKIADELLKSSFAKHLIREQADRQIVAWIKWRIVPVSIVLSTAAVLFGWKEISLSKTLEDQKKEITQMQKDSDGISAKLMTAQGLIDVARQAAESGKEAAKEGNATVLASLGVVRDTSKDVGGVNRILDESNGKLKNITSGISEQDGKLSDVSDKAKALGASLEGQTARLDALDKKREDLDRKFQELKAAREELMPDIRRFRAYHVQVLTTGRITNNIVQFGDPEGKRRPYRMRLVGLEESSPGSGYFSAYLTLNGPDASSYCISNKEITLKTREAFELASLNDFQKIPNCLPAGVKLFVDATPHLSMPSGKDSQPAAQFIFLRVDTEVIEPNQVISSDDVGH